MIPANEITRPGGTEIYCEALVAIRGTQRNSARQAKRLPRGRPSPVGNKSACARDTLCFLRPDENTIFAKQPNAIRIIGTLMGSARRPRPDAEPARDASKTRRDAFTSVSLHVQLICVFQCSTSYHRVLAAPVFHQREVPEKRSHGFDVIFRSSESTDEPSIRRKFAR